MLLEIFWLSAQKIVSLMGFFVVGYVLAKKRLLPEDAPQTLSKLLTLLFCPALTLNSLAQNLNRDSVREHAGLILVGAVVAAVLVAVSRPLSRALSRGDEDLRGLLDYDLIYGNYGYLGYPMIEGVFGAAALSRFLLFLVPLNVLCYTYGRMVVEGRRKVSLKFLLSPLSLSLWLGIGIGLLEIRLPAVAADFLSASGGCTGPVSMLITGMILSRTDLARSFREPANYLFTALRLAVIPLCALAVMLPLGVRGEAMLFTGVFMCFPFGNNPIVFREAMGQNAQKAAGMTIVSYVFSLITVPVMFMLFRSLSGLG